MTNFTHIHRSAAREDGVTMIIAMLVMLVTSLLITAVFVSVRGDTQLTSTNTNQKKAYYAAMAGISAYKYQQNSNASYWKKCPSITETAIPKASEEKYKVKTVPAEGHTENECKEEKQSAILEATGSAVGTFRIESTGIYGTGANRVTRSLIATFTHPGFLNYVYLTNYEILDPAAQEPEPTNCEHYYKYRVEHNLTKECGTIEFAPEDKVNGPMHTNDAAAICAEGGKEPTFGREGHEDKIEMNGGYYEVCSGPPKFIGKGYTTSGPTLTPPETDSELLEAADYKFKGRTYLELKTGTPNTIAITNSKGEKEPTKDFPANGVIYVENNGSCPIKYTPFNSNYEGDTNCGNVYVRGEYTESLTIAAENDVIIDGNTTTTTETSEKKPTGDATLGLIATNFVRIYHPVKTGYTVSNVVPATEAAINGKCVSVKELSATILKSTEVTGITTTGLAVGDEVEGTVAGQIEAGTTISEIKASENKVKLSKAAKPATKELSATILKSTEVTGITTTGLAVGDEVEGTVAGQIETGTTISEIKTGNKIKLSKAAKPATKELSAKITNGSKEVTEITTTGLAVGDEVEGAGIETGTTISEIKTGNKIKLSNEAKKTETGVKLKFYSSETTKLKFYGEATKLKLYVSTGYEYNSTLNECHKVESGYSKYIASENRYIAACESGSTYTSNGFCEYENNSKTCSSKATNLTATEDPRGWGTPTNIEIDAAILSTAHSFIVDNFKCGAHLGDLNVWGAIAQFWRGPVGTGSGSTGTGYSKNYNYDERLATNQPPDFLTPSSSELKLSRVTAPPNGFGEG